MSLEEMQKKLNKTKERRTKMAREYNKTSVAIFRKKDASEKLDCIPPRPRCHKTNRFKPVITKEKKTKRQRDQLYLGKE